MKLNGLTIAVLLAAAALAVLVLTGVAQAQTTAPAGLPDGINTTSLRAQLGTVSGIAALALLGVQVVKWSLARYDIAVLSKVPTPVLVIAVGVGLTLLANLVLKTLPGDLLDLIWQGVFASGMSSAVFSWLKNGTDAPADKTPTASLPMSGKSAWLGVLMVPLVLISGCGLTTKGLALTLEQKKRVNFAEASEIYQGACDVLVPIIRMKVLSEAQAREIAQVVQLGRMCLDEWAAAIELKLPTADIVAKWRIIIADLVAKRIAAQRASAQAKIDTKAALEVTDYGSIDRSVRCRGGDGGDFSAHREDLAIAGLTGAGQAEPDGHRRADRRLRRRQRLGGRRDSGRGERDVWLDALADWRIGQPIPPIEVEIEYD